MKIITIFAQLNESYPGQYAPDCLGAQDEYGREENPDYLDDIMKKAQKGVVSGEYRFVKYMEFEIDDKEFDRVFYGETLKAKVVNK